MRHPLSAGFINFFYLTACIVFSCIVQTSMAAFPPRKLTMAQMFGGRSIQAKYYDPGRGAPLQLHLTPAYDMGFYINLLYTPWYQAKFPIDLLVGYEFTKADQVLLYADATQQLTHNYYCNYICGGLLLNMLDFADLCLYGGYGIGRDDFTHSLNGGPLNYLNQHLQLYIMPGLEFFATIPKTEVLFKMGFFVKKELIGGWDLNGGAIGGYSHIDHTGNQLLVRLTLGYGRRSKEGGPQLQLKDPPPKFNRRLFQIKHPPGQCQLTHNLICRLRRKKANSLRPTP